MARVVAAFDDLLLGSNVIGMLRAAGHEAELVGPERARPDAAAVLVVDLAGFDGVALVPLVLLTRRADIMGALVNRRLTTVVASIVAALIIALNAFLLYETLLG